MSKDGIKVNNEKKTIYFLLAIYPLILILLLIEFFTSKKINPNNKNNRIIVKTNRNWKFVSFISRKLLLINVKNIIKPRDKVDKKSIVINIFRFRKVNIN